MTLELFIVCIGFLIGGVIASLVCNELLLRFSQSLGIRNKNDVVVRWANESKPSLGGVAFFIAFVFGAIAYSVLFPTDNIFQNHAFVGLMLAGLFAFVMGLSDDAYNTRPMIKLVVQISCGLILYFSNTSIHLTGNEVINCIITIVWVVGIMNSLNMLDNMDGITGTTVLFILISCLASDFILFDWNMNIWTLTLMVQIGAILGFLRYNIHPSKLFMGDAGSQFIGLFAAFFSIHDLWSVSTKTALHPAVGMIVTLLAFTPAAADTFTVVINRLRKGKSPMVGGKDHTTHHLVYAGLKDMQVWLVFLGISILSTLIAVLAIIFAKMGNAYMTVFLSLYFCIVFFLLYRNTLIHKR